MKEHVRMEAVHVSILRKNLLYLKEHLEVEEVLDYLYQETIFTQSEYHRCRQAGPDKCGTVLEILMKKGENGYKSLCEALDRSQPHIKEQLDRTSAEQGATDLQFVNKQKLERQYSEAVTKKERIITNLQHEVTELKQTLALKEEELADARKTNEETTKRCDIQLKEEKKKFESILEKEISEKRIVTVKLEQSEREVDHLKANVEHLSAALADKTEILEALTKVECPDNDCERNIERNENESNFNTETCVLSIQGICDVSQLLLLPCLHAACKPCIDHYPDVLDNQETLLCPCGAHVELKNEALAEDYVRRNEAVYNALKESGQSCTYKHHKKPIEAVVVCQDCDDYLCPRCETSHGKIKKNKNHQTNSIQGIKHGSIREWLTSKRCQEHPNHQLELYDKNCRKAICILCSVGSHKHANNEDLVMVYRQRETELLNLRKHLRHQVLDTIEISVQILREHQGKLSNTASSLEARVVSVQQDVARRFLRRQKKLIQDIRLSFEGPNHAVHQKLKTFRAAEESVKSMIDYIDKILECTRKPELISLTDTMEVLSTDLLKTEHVLDDTRDTKIRLSFQGQKVLEEVIDEFGSVATCLSMEEFTDSQPTIKDMRQEIACLTKSLTFTRNELKMVQEEKKRMEDEILLMYKDTEENKMIRRKTEKRLAELEHIHCLLLQADGSLIHVTCQAGSSKSFLVSCPPMMLSRTRVVAGLQVSEDKHELTNPSLTSDNLTQAGHESSFQFYSGTCSSFTIPTSATTVTHYWEANTRIQVKSQISWTYPLLEVGVCEEGKVDTDYWMSYQRRSWCVRIVTCRSHQPGICTQVCGEGQDEEHGDCLLNTVSNTPGTDVEVHYGVLLDAGKGILAFLDLDREVLLHKFEAEFKQPLVPLFGVHLHVSELDKCGSCELKMRLVSGQDIIMTENKKSLIHRVLTTL